MSDLDDAAKRIAAMGKSRVNPDVEKAMRGEKGKRECEYCGQEIKDDTNVEAEMMDRGMMLRKK